MSIGLVVRSRHSGGGKNRSKLAGEVIGSYREKLGLVALLCFLDDVDHEPFKRDMGAANRGFYIPLRDSTPHDRVFPEYLTNALFDESLMDPRRLFDELIYLHGSTCEDPVGLAVRLPALAGWRLVVWPGSVRP